MTPDRPLRLAVYGYVEEHAGSVASANYQILRELLGRGHAIDFYAIDGWVRAGGLAAFPTLRYRPVRHDGWRAFEGRLHRLPWPRVRDTVQLVAGPVGMHLYRQAIGDAIRRAHRRDRYDALLVVGLLSPWRVPGLPTVSWTQGTPNGEAEWYARNPRAVTRQMGAAYLPLVAAAYTLKYLEAAAQHPRSDVVIAGGRWAVESWRRFGVPARKLAALPYPLDLTAFAPHPPPADKPAGEVRFLHLGRVVPRKRIDLLLAALDLVRRDDPAVRAEVVGGSPFRRTAAWVREAVARVPGAEYRPAVPRAEVPGLLARADCVAQPSEHENFGSAVAEGLAAGRPVLLGPTNGSADAVGDSPAVIRFAAYTPEAVAAGMREAARRVRADRAGLAVAARAAAEAAFALPAVTDRLLERIAAARRTAR